MGAPSTSTVRDVDGDRFTWRERGEGPLVVLLHGLGGSRLSWEPQLATLGDRRRVAAWDLPGYGRSAPLPDTTVPFRSLAAAAADWIAALAAGPAHVVGISMGGMIAQYLAAWHPDTVRSLTLMSSSPRFGLDGTSPATWSAARLAPLDEGLEPADFSERVLRAIAGPRITDEALAEQRVAMSCVSGTALRRSIECVVTHDSRSLLPSIVHPTLVLVGEFDRETPPEYSQYIADHVPHATLVVVPHAGHLLNVEAPDQVNRLITQHLTAVEAT
ncbi:MAG: alpha/beta fold hydrolase [Ilumatobacteraceae bacterium]